MKIGNKEIDLCPMLVKSMTEIAPNMVGLTTVNWFGIEHYHMIQQIYKPVFEKTIIVAWGN